ncbi:hypothetical protein E1B28_006053 [Marasmius oreades]|uniref:DUF7223 domain-containing protein n=1 Tax=Marasmius oreades TaxID=181124 RepID=A0A9P7UW03_9AGAR|nr:uncharacterized protein E1B28_006053 [Marasmius oreades]KAG7095281.1 hypothetical protein E1B28_006053 [Marasmius oreades]
MVKSLPAFALTILLPLSTYAKNDWSIPCFDGTCSYDSPAGLGSVTIWGTPSAIADITKTAGWTILNCDENALVQDIRLVCTGTAEECNNLYANTGATGKLVRLPENCGGNAFARISRTWVHEDQSLPVELARALRKRDGPTPSVQGLALDTDFGAIDPAQNGNVSLAIEGATVPGAAGDFNVTATNFDKRGLFDFVKNAFEKFDSFDKNLIKELPPIDVDKSFNLLNEQLPCPANGASPAFEASIKADTITKAHAVVTVGMAASGTIVPPKFSEFGVFAGLNADLQGTLSLEGSASVSRSIARNFELHSRFKLFYNAQGTVDSGRIPLFEVGIPGLDFPGILTLGPSFQIQAQAKATLDIDAKIDVTLAYHVEDAKLFFPPLDGNSGGQFQPADSPLKLSVSPSLASKAIVEGHLIPTLQLGITALGGTAKANVFLDLDANAAATLSLDAVAAASTDGTQSTSVNGCIDVASGFDVNAGADASFFDLFDSNTKVNLFTKKFQLFKKCLPGSETKASLTRRVQRRMSRRSAFLAKLDKRASLTCPGVSFENIVSVVDEALPATQIEAL